MKNAKVISIAILFCISITLSHQAFAQGCSLLLTNYFSVYKTTGHNDNTVSQTIRIEGYSSVGVGLGCNMSVAKHTPQVFNKIGTAGGLTSGTAGCPSCYYDYQNTLQIVGVPGVQYVANGDGDMFCSLAGTFLTVAVPTTTFIPIQVPPSSCTIDGSGNGDLICNYHGGSCTQQCGALAPAAQNPVCNTSTHGAPGVKTGNNTTRCVMELEVTNTSSSCQMLPPCVEVVISNGP